MLGPERYFLCHAEVELEAWRLSRVTHWVLYAQIPVRAIFENKGGRDVLLDDPVSWEISLGHRQAMA